MPSIKDILKKIGLVAVKAGPDVVPIFIPAAGPAITAIENLVKHDGDPGQNVADAFASAIQVAEQVKDEDIADEAKVHAGILMMDQGRKLFLDGLKKQ